MSNDSIVIFCTIVNILLFTFFVEGNYSEQGINDKVIGYRINIDAYILSIIMDT